MQVRCVALENRVWFELHDNIQITRWAAIGARLALARQADTIIGIDTGRNFDFQRFRGFLGACAITRLARMLDDHAAAATLRTGLLHREKAL